MDRREFVPLIGAALALAAVDSWAQPAPAVRRIGVLGAGLAAETYSPLGLLFFETLRRSGYEPGRNLRVDSRHAEGDVARLPALAQELVALEVELIVAFTNVAIAAARQATRSLPIVMGYALEPVASGFVDSLARPGGNVTGTAWVSAEIAGKNLQILKEAVPRATRVAVLSNHATPGIQFYGDDGRRAAAALGVTLEAIRVPRPEDIGPALERVDAIRADAIYIVNDPVIDARLGEITAFALGRKLATVGAAPQLVAAGGLIYYGPDAKDIMVRTVSFIDRILRGARPAELPVEQPTKFELVINLKTAKALGLVIPQALLLRADEVIQ